MHKTLGLDIGGANLKAADGKGQARSRPFALWKNPQLLGRELEEVIKHFPSWDALAVTMTGELCDCFASRSHGVQAILDAVSVVAGDRPWQVWTTAGFVDPQTARTRPLQAASANWLALAGFACRFAPGPGLLIDIGSTTTDLIPLGEGKPVPKGFTDRDRLRTMELVYTGVRRTPVLAVLGNGLAAELFATMQDVYLCAGQFPDEPENRDTADGRPATAACAHARLARMLGTDADICTGAETKKLAERAIFRQVYLLSMAFDHVVKPQPPRTVVLAGEGEFLARLVLTQQNSFRNGQVISLQEKLGPDVSRAACAHAVAVLAEEGYG